MSDSLNIQNLTIRSDTRTVVDNVSLKVPAGKIVALLGPNGAGKSELVLGVAGVMPRISGDVAIGDKKISRNVSAIRAAGVAAVPEGHQVLTGLSVAENLLAAGPLHDQSALADEAAKALEVLPELKKVQHQLAGSLSGGQQQMVAIAQALISRPKFLLIDEMSLGLAPVIIERLVSVVCLLKDRGMGILLIEQFTQIALNIADYCYVMAQGKIRFGGAPDRLRADRSILETAYLGQ